MTGATTIWAGESTLIVAAASLAGGAALTAAVSSLVGEGVVRGVSSLVSFSVFENTSSSSSNSELLVEDLGLWHLSVVVIKSDGLVVSLLDGDCCTLSPFAVPFSLLALV